MRIKVVLSRATLDLLWANSDPNRRWVANKIPIAPDESIVELDEEVVSSAIDLFDNETFDEAIRRLAHIRLTDRDEG